MQQRHPLGRRGCVVAKGGTAKAPGDRAEGGFLSATPVDTVIGRVCARPRLHGRPPGLRIPIIAADHVGPGQQERERESGKIPDILDVALVGVVIRDLCPMNTGVSSSGARIRQPVGWPANRTTVAPEQTLVAVEHPFSVLHDRVANFGPDPAVDVSDPQIAHVESMGPDHSRRRLEVVLQRAPSQQPAAPQLHHIDGSTRETAPSESQEQQPSIRHEPPGTHGVPHGAGDRRAGEPAKVWPESTSPVRPAQTMTIGPDVAPRVTSRIYWARPCAWNAEMPQFIGEI